MRPGLCLAIPCALVLLLAGACGTTSEPPRLGVLYNRSAQHHDARRNPVIVIPGILGSRLKDTQTGWVVWGSFTGDYADPTTAEGARLFSLPMAAGRPLDALRDGVVPNGVVGTLEASFLGIGIEVDAYRHILGTLGAGGYLDEESANVDYGKDHFTCFQFAYDWRRDISDSARELQRFILEKRAYVQQEIEKRFGHRNAPVKFDIVAHSMGGLVARWFMRYGNQPVVRGDEQPTWAGAELVDRLILVGTPNAGSLDALVKLTSGEDFSIITPEYDAAVIGTFPALYQLLPRTRHGPLRVSGRGARGAPDLYDVRTWRRFRWGLLDPERDDVLRKLLPAAGTRKIRVQIAEEHLVKCLDRARVVHAALDAPATPPAPVKLVLFAGDAKATARVARVDPVSGAIEIADRAAGDGTVLRDSALLDERLTGEWRPYLQSPIAWSQVMFLFSDHLGMTMDPHFTDNLLFQLLEAPR